MRKLGSWKGVSKDETAWGPKTTAAAKRFSVEAEKGVGKSKDCEEVWERKQGKTRS